MQEGAAMNAHLAPSHIVGIGASAGGLASLEEFFKAMPTDSGMAFVLVQHLSPDFKSLMDDLLARHTKMSIHRVANGQELEANAIYLIPPRQVMTIADGRLYLQERVGQHLILPIDIFFESLAGAANNKAIGIILSGTGSDGSRGIQAIHEAGGLVLVQSLESAQFDGMPRAAINTGMCDYVTTPGEMPTILVEYAQHPDVMQAAKPELHIVWDEGEFAEIFAHLRRSYSLDFSKYKPSTVERRIARRLGFHHMQKLSEYIKLLADDPQELDSLYRDLLIGVTEFFRDSAVFAYLEREVIPALFRDAVPDGLRVWVAACATGEEAYSLAILLHDYAERSKYPGKISIFATDVHRKSLDIASQGIYAEQQLHNVSAEHLARYFTPEGDGKYKIIPDLRRMVIFAPQNLLSDPPFTKIDLVSCRNLLIYFLPETQEKVIASFNYSLRMDGVLFLGISEGVGKFSEEFASFHSAYKIYRKKHEVRLNLSVGEVRGKPTLLAPFDRQRHTKNSVSIDRQTLHDYDQIISRLVPAGVLLNEHHQILHYFGTISQYLKPLAGLAESDFTRMVMEELHLPVSVALQRAMSLKGRFSMPSIPLPQGEEGQRVDISVDCIPYEQANALHYLVTFTPIRSPDLPPDATDAAALMENLDTTQTLQTHIAELELDLQFARENLQATVEELQTSNEELQAANEELLAANEELQSTNEELHSLNEELYTVNAEYEKKNAELQTLNDDHAHLLASLDIGVVYLDDRLTIRKFNPASASSFQLMPHDIGRPIAHIAYQLTDQKEILASIQTVLKTGQKIENEAQTQNGIWLLQRILPYLNDKQEVKGVILTFTDVTKLKNNESQLRTLFELLPVGVTILDKDRHVVEANQALEKTISLSRSDLLDGRYGQRSYIRPDGSPMPAEEFASARVLREQTAVSNIETGILKENGTLVWTNVSAAPLPDGGLVVVTADITERKQAEQDLQRWAEIFRNVAWGVVLGSADGTTIELTNPAFAAMHGYAETELVGAPITSVFAPEARADLPRHISLAHERGHHTFETKHVHRDGTVFPVALDIVAVKDDAGRVRYRIVSVQNLSEQTRMQSEQRESEARLATIIDSAMDAVISVDEEQRVTVFNPSAEAIFMYSADEVLGQSLAMLIPERFREAHRADVAAFGKTHVTTRSMGRLGSLRGLRSTGEEFPIEASISHTERNGQHFFTVILRDITERHRAEAKLRESEEKYRGLLESLDNSVVMVDADGRFNFANDEAARQLGSSAADLVGKTMHELFPQEYADRQMDTVRQVFREDAPLLLERQSFTGGRVRWYRTTIQPLHDDAGNVAFALINTTDITDLKHAQQELEEFNRTLEQRVEERTAEVRQASRALEQASRAKDAFLANMSHELRTPLNGILGSSEILLAGYRGHLNERQRTFISTIDASGRHLLSLINDILDLSKIEADKLELHLESISIAEVCQASVAFIKELALKKGLAVTIAIDKGLDRIQADPRRLKQILANLLNNAVKFTPAGGSITLEARHNQENNSVELCVSDTGIGISAENQKLLFAPFTQLDNSISRSYEGTGLGLTLVRRLAELHGGSVSLQSEEGKGSRFTVALPWKDAAPETLVSAAAGMDAIPYMNNPIIDQKNKATVLLVEDNATNMLTILDYMDALGYSVVTASDGYEALAKAAESAPDVILMDIQMPHMDGLEAIRRLRADPQFATTPIIALTALAMPGDRERCLEAGATEYMSKPVKLKALATMVERLLR